MKGKKLSISLIVVLCALGINSAHAVRISLMGIGTYANYAISDTTSVTPRGSYGGGLWFTFPFGRVVALDLGANYLQNQIGISSAVLNYTYVNFPALLTFSFLKFFPIYAGGYYSLALSTATTVGSITTTATTGLKNDYGFEGGAGFRIPLGSKLKLRIDGLYQYGMANISSGSATQYSRSLLGQIGIMF